MPDVTTGLRECRDRVRALGFRVEEVPGWPSRGKGRLSPDRAVNHHDAIRGPSPVAGLRVVTFGRPGLENALGNTYGERGPGAAIWIVAAGVAWHAGTGSWQGVSGNNRAIGRENANDGVGEPYHPDALAVQLAWDAVQSDVFGIPPAMYCEHHEWTPRKVDRRYDGAKWRRQIAAFEDNEEDDVQEPYATLIRDIHEHLPALRTGLDAIGALNARVDQIEAQLAHIQGPALGEARRNIRRVGKAVGAEGIEGTA